MIPVRKALRLHKVSFKMLFISTNAVRIESYISLDAGSPSLCSTEGASHPCAAHGADLVHERRPILII